MGNALPFKSEPIGEVECLDCGWQHATVRPNRRNLLWSYCDSCRSQHFTRDRKGSDGLRRRMRPLTPGAGPQPEPILPPPPEPPMPKPKPKPRKPTPARKPAPANELPPRRAQPAAPAQPADDDDDDEDQEFGREIFGDD
jgi:hypothetical protein